MRGPVADRCSSAALRGCDDIADGVVLVVDGHKAEGLEKVERGAGQNSPESVRAFADALATVADTPGLGSYGAQIREVADALKHAPGDAHAASSPDALQRAQLDAAIDRHPYGAASVAAAAAHEGASDSNLRVGTTSPATLGQACTTALGDSRCERILLGPAELTDVIAAGGSPAPFIVFAGKPESPGWQIVVPANGSITLTSAQIPVADDDRVEVATPSGGAQSASCGVTWVARRR